MNEKMQIIPKGTVFIVSDGAYSDYSVIALCTALVDIDADALRAEYLAENPDQVGDYAFSSDGFMAFLARKGIVEEMNYMELHAADYACASEMWVREESKE